MCSQAISDKQHYSFCWGRQGRKLRNHSMNQRRGKTHVEDGGEKHEVHEQSQSKVQQHIQRS